MKPLKLKKPKPAVDTVHPALKDGYHIGDIYQAGAQYGNGIKVIRVTGFPSKTTMSIEVLETNSRNLYGTGSDREDEITLVVPLQVKYANLRARDSKLDGWGFYIDHGNGNKQRYYIHNDPSFKITNPSTWKHVKCTYY